MLIRSATAALCLTLAACAPSPAPEADMSSDRDSQVLSDLKASSNGGVRDTRPMFSCRETSLVPSGDLATDILGTWRDCQPQIDEGWHYCLLRSDGTYSHLIPSTRTSWERAYTFDAQTGELEMNDPNVNTRERVKEVTDSELVFEAIDSTEFRWRRVQCSGLEIFGF